MARAAENFEKMVSVWTKFLQKWQPPPQKFSPPLLGQPPPFVKNLASPPLWPIFQKWPAPPQARGVKLYHGYYMSVFIPL